MAQRSGGAVRSLEAFPLDVRITNVFISYVKYIGNALWPRKLAVYYPHPGYALSAWQNFGIILFMVVVFSFTIHSFRKYPYVIVGLFWYFGTLVPVIGLLQVGSQAMADRYTYIPLIGLFLLIAWGIPDMLANRPYQRIVLSAFAALILLTLSVGTFVQVSYWENSVRLFKNTIKVTVKNWKAHNNLGIALFEQGKVDEAIHHYRKALSIRPGFVFAHSNLGGALVKKGNLTEAASHYKTALRINPEFAFAHYKFGTLLLKQKKFKEAMRHFVEAIRIHPEYTGAYYSIGWILESWGKYQGARGFFAKAIQLDPDFVEARKNLENIDRILLIDK
jgi:tetratricopeptide (TPR) repeat protein